MGSGPVRRPQFRAPRPLVGLAAPQRGYSVLESFEHLQRAERVGTRIPHRYKRELDLTGRPVASDLPLS